VEFGIVATNQGWLDGHWELLDGTRFTALYVVDHPSFPIPDPWTYLAFVAARTRRIRLGTHVTGAAFHHPTELAKQIATVDVLSGGRATLGIGTAYEHQDFAPYGFPMPSARVRREILEETIILLKSLWTRESTAFDGLHFCYEGGAAFAPKPVQHPHPPIIVGVNTPGALLRLAVRHATGINTWQLGPAQVAALRAALAGECESSGRAPDSVRLTADVLLARGADEAGARTLAAEIAAMARSWGRSAAATRWDAAGVLFGDAAAMREQVRQFAAVGVSELSVAINGVDDLVWFSDNVIAGAP